MCSIGGFISSSPLDRRTSRALCTALIWYGSGRGSQSSGVYYRSASGSHLAKRAVSPASFIESSDFFNVFDGDGSMALTHTRTPTSGGTDDYHAQPFQCGETVIVHNGMIFNTDECRKRWSIVKPSGVDSELYSAFIAHQGINKLPDFMEYTEGCSAIAAIHNDNLYLMRSGNPTFFTTFPLGDNQILVFASTEEQLLRSIYHTFLMHDDPNIQGTQQHIMLSASALKLKPLGRKIRPVTYGIDWDSYRVCQGYHTYSPKLLTPGDDKYSSIVRDLFQRPEMKHLDHRNLPLD